MPHYRKREETARIIWDILDKHGDCNRWQIMHIGDLTESQFQYGMGFAKEILQTDEGQPLIWSPYQGVYSLTNDEADWQYYLMVYRGKSIYSQVVNWEQCAIAGGMKFGKHKKATRVMLAGITAARQMIEALM